MCSTCKKKTYVGIVKEASCMLHHMYIILQSLINSYMIKLCRVKITFPLFSETIICKVTENTCIKESSIKCICTNRVHLIPASFKIRTTLLNSLSMTLPHRGTWHHNWWPLTTRLQWQLTSTHPTISRTHWSFEFGTKFKHFPSTYTNIQMRWLPLYDGAVPS